MPGDDHSDGSADAPPEPADAPPDPADTSPPPAGRADRRRRVLRATAAVWLLVIAFGAGYLVAHPRPPLDTSADAGFLRDMSVHHAQAVEMSLLVLQRTDDPALSTVAYDIATTQQSQVGRMRGWLEQWDLPARRPGPAMEWMSGHEGHGGGDAPETMPGVASAADMDALRAADGRDAEKRFLRLMIDHHQGGVEMAEAGARLIDDPDLAGFADGMAEAQRSETKLLSSLLAERTG
ncbi:uncharacterized protein (DUF305 family) [Murinocardiopsis flavida]|uniref:Uncharacterized protein (DUF305 family) n=1 Tax=Murinocardiopsis flavida TaxID=645275 RepID=A0A2P8DPC8_9ACTN|nr:DUF305 domain-containing protein [Murinocardiopsis flavida]PSK99074.1 uncharacterized protein (DUF305 family) [Murinocardiopsis flavida]